MFANGEGDLNPAQRVAVGHRGGHLLIVAGAGTGKTRTLAARLAGLVASGIAPERVLLLTFSRRAARELLARAALHTPAAARVQGGTFHAVAVRLLRARGAAVGLDPSFSVVDPADSADLLDLARAELGLGGPGRRFPQCQTLQQIYSRMVNSRTPLREVLERHFPWCRDDAGDIARLFEEYLRRKRAQTVLDFDDLLLWWLALARSDRGTAELFGHVLVDEYQDTNALQADILEELAHAGAEVTAVGDDAQAIYGFRAATPANMLEFPVRFAGARTVRLEANYRSTRQILEVANAVMSGAAGLHRKRLRAGRDGPRPSLVTCPDEAGQSEAVCEAVLEARERGVALRSQAVLFRTGHHSAHLEIELARRNIPFVKYGGLRFVEAAHVKDVVALLRLLDNPRDELAWMRALRLLEGVGPASALRAIGHIREQSTPTPRALASAPLPAQARGGRADLVAALEDCLSPGLSCAAQIERLARWCAPAFERAYDHAAVRLADLERLAALAAGYRSRRALVADLVLDPPRSTSELAGPPRLDDDYLVLSTIHSAKGLEWDEVHLIHAADGMIPSDMAAGCPEELEEERRLLYVALTRARNRLRIYFPLRFHYRRSGRDDAHGWGQLCRFIDAGVRRHLEEVALPGCEGAAGDAHSARLASGAVRKGTDPAEVVAGLLSG